MKIMENKDIKEFKKDYTIAHYYNLKYSDITSLKEKEKDYLMNVIHSSLERGDSVCESMMAQYEKDNCTIFKFKKDSNKELEYKGNKIYEAEEQNIKEYFYDKLQFNPNTFIGDFGISFENDQKIYIKEDDLKISYNDIIYLEVFGILFEVTRSRIVDVFELGGKFNELKLKKYKKREIYPNLSKLGL